MDKLYLEELKNINEIKIKMPKFGPKKIKERGGISKTTEVLVAADTILGVASLAYTAILRGKTETCKRTTDNIDQFEVCMARFKVKALEESRSILSNKISYCYKSNDPEKCQAKISSKIDKITAIIEDLKERHNL